MISKSLKNLIPTANTFSKIEISGLFGSALALGLRDIFLEGQKTLMIVVEDSKVAFQLEEDLNFFLKNPQKVEIFQSLGVMPYYGLSPSSGAIASRIKFLHRLLSDTQPWIGILPLSSLHRRLPPKKAFQEAFYYLSLGDQIEREDLLKKLLELGYQNAPLVEDGGTFSKRGGIVDIFPPHLDRPIRLEFFGSELESLRYFDPETQRSREEILDVTLIPAREILLAEENFNRASRGFRERANEMSLAKPHRESFLEALKQRMTPLSLETYAPIFFQEMSSILDYVTSQALWVTVDAENFSQHWEHEKSELQLAFASCQTAEKVIAHEELFLSPDEIEKKLDQKNILAFSLLTSHAAQKVIPIEGHEDWKVLLRSAVPGDQMLQPLIDRLREWLAQQYQVVILCSSHPQLMRLEDLLKRYNLPLRRSTGDFTDLNQVSPQILLQEGLVSQGFVWPESRLVLITDQEIFGEKQRRRPEKKVTQAFTTFEELSEGDYIVHEQHGLGIYQGLQTLNIDGQLNDFLLLEYQGGDKLYLPVYRLNLVNRYAGREGELPVLDRLGGASWEKSKEKVREALRLMASELLQLYAARATAEGHAFAPGGLLYEEFEALFPFEETPDQLKAIQDVDQDLSLDKPMDRLVCGDVGFGKTEVAMRAAFRAVADNKQVAVLVPTTVLALQHERNFRTRFQKFPAVIEMLSRFTDNKKQKEIIEKLKHGKVDIVVGTHALLGKDVGFKDLALLIIDEEHRFGVAQKEKIKQLRQNAHVLAMTATPIPRTLNMSLQGIRDLSVITTPPVDRFAIQTFVAQDNDALIREAIHRELSRGGQVYFVHNRVQTIASQKSRLEQLVPEAKVEIAHGQMNEKDLEKVMIGFLNHEFNVLLCTTIIESGLDIPSANTMIVNRADTFGLAQLYQLRGRIGRSNQRAFAYLLTPGQELITPKARSRLAVLQRYTELGSGFKIAAHDLEIRGAGNLLGAQQSGHIASVGYELYLQLMEEAIQEVKGEQKAKAPDPEIQIALSAAIPEEYIPETTMRLMLYKRFAATEDEEEIAALAEETRDRFGELPENFNNLMIVMRLKVWAKKVWIKNLRVESQQVVFVFSTEAPLEVADLTLKMQKAPSTFRWLKPYELAMQFHVSSLEEKIEETVRFLMNLKLNT